MKDYGKAYLNLCVMGLKMAITNGKLYEWKYDDSEEDSEKSEFYWNEAENKFVLGDLNKLVEFLIESSGKRSIIEEAIHGK